MTTQTALEARPAQAFEPSAPPAPPSPISRRTRRTQIAQMPAPRPQPEYTVLIPCYNEAAGIRSTLDTFVRQLDDGHRFELVVVDDGSSDGTGAVLDEAARAEPRIQLVRHPRNRGYGASLKTGIRHASTDVIVITDADGTYPNERIPELVRLAAQADMVVGARTAPGVRYSRLRAIPKLFLRRWVCWVTRREIPDMNSGLRVFRKSIAERFFKVLPDGFSFTTTITVSMIRNGFDVRFVPVGYAPRLGHSKIRPIRDTLGFCRLILRTSLYFAPLRLLMPLVVLLAGLLALSAGSDVLATGDVTGKTTLLGLLTLNTSLFAFLADMIDKRSGG